MTSGMSYPRTAGVFRPGGIGFGGGITRVPRTELGSPGNEKSKRIFGTLSKFDTGLGRGYSRCRHLIWCDSSSKANTTVRDSGIVSRRFDTFG